MACTELKFNHGKQFVEMGEPHIWVSIIGKFLPHTLVWLAITFFYSFYVFGIMGFPHPGGVLRIVLLNVLMYSRHRASDSLPLD